MAFVPETDDRLEPIVRLVHSDREAGLRELTQLAEAGEKSAILYLGLYLSEEQQTSEAAVKWLLLANEFESPDAAWNLAMIARERDKSDEMKHWIDRAAELDEEDAKEIQGNGYDVVSVIARSR
jgi:TPR repeat protein